MLKQFAAALNDIIVKRYNDSREVGDNIHVSFYYAPKSRTLNELVNKAQHVKLPCVSVSLGGIRRDSNRVFNKIDGSWWLETQTSNPSASKWLDLYQPVPIDITVNTSIIARFQSDVDQILSNFIPYTDPYFVISWKWPGDIEIGDIEIRSPVLWNENINISYPIDVPNNRPYWTVADTSFTIKGWMFKNIPPGGQPIYVIDCSFTAISSMDGFSVMQSFEEDYNTDYFQISARPQSTNIYPYISYIDPITDTQRTFIVEGKMFDYVETIYLSSYNWDMFDYSTAGDFVTSPSEINIFGVSSFAASAEYPAFYGIELVSANWHVADKNHIHLSFTPQESGKFDIILMNAAGYGLFTKDCIRPILNPYISGTYEYNNYEEYQLPCISGIEIHNV